ncbi:peroxidase, partial [Streptomyces griseus]|nr:peroxidase [Streptomyces griseus]
PPPAPAPTGNLPEPVPAPVRQEPPAAGADHGSLRIGSLQESAQ